MADHADKEATQDVKQPSKLTKEYAADGVRRILSLDGGGAKGFYTIGVLKEIEGMLGCPLHKRFDLIFGTSTGAIIAALLALGREVDDIHELYRSHVPQIMERRTKRGRSKALHKLAREVFQDAKFTDTMTGIGIVATKWMLERPMIFKRSVEQAHGSKGTFVPGFGVPISDAVEASCSAYPFFKKKTVVTADKSKIVLVDGGFCANNPTLYAIADAVKDMAKTDRKVSVVSVGVGEYPSPKKYGIKWFVERWPTVKLLQKVLEINTQSMDQLRAILFADIPTVRVSDAFTQPEMATDLMEHDLDKLDLLLQRGRQSFAKHEKELKAFLL